MDPYGIERHGQYVAVNCRDADIPLWLERARALAALCLDQKVNRVLIDATDCDPDGHHALREALATLILGGVPAGFRLALVTNVSRLQAFFGSLQRDLEYLRIPARCFAEDDAALEWLLNAPGARSTAAQNGARQEARSTDAP